MHLKASKNLRSISRLLTPLILLVFSASIEAQEKPNVIIMVADDIGYADPSFRGSPIETPAIDRLAREGAVLDRFYATPICTPRRN